jgi:hypothetical protein
MKILLLKVEDTFNINGQDLILAPAISEETNLPKSKAVSPVRPDGGIFRTKAIFEIPFLSFYSVEDSKKHKPAYNCILRNTGKKEVPIGTRVRLD